VSAEPPIRVESAEPRIFGLVPPAVALVLGLGALIVGAVVLVAGGLIAGIIWLAAGIALMRWRSTRAAAGPPAPCPASRSGSRTEPVATWGWRA
jgi:hypothetical protein